MNTFGPPKLVLTRGEGASVWDDAGKEYLDLLGGIAVNSLGHAHPALVEAVTTQMQTLGHVSNFFATEPQVRLAERLLSLLGGAPGQGLLRQLRRRGQRGRAQAHPQDRPHPRGRHRGRLPRPHHGRARADREGGLPRAVRAPARWRHLRAVRRREGPRRGGDRPDRRGDPRTVAGRGRRGRATAALPRPRAGDHRRARRAAVARRDPDRHRPHRCLVRPPEPGRGSPDGRLRRHRHRREGSRGRLPDRRVHRHR